MAAYGKDLKAVVGLNIMRGFPPGSDQGATKAKPEIWKNLEDFQKKLEAMQTEATKLGETRSPLPARPASPAMTSTRKKTTDYMKIAGLGASDSRYHSSPAQAASISSAIQLAATRAPCTELPPPIIGPSRFCPRRR